MMPVKSELQLDMLKPNMKKLTDLSKKYDVTGVHAFTVNSEDGHIHARNFAPLCGIDEEAATGTSNGALIYYLYDYNYIRTNKIYTVIQGEKMKRPSKITTIVEETFDSVNIKVGGFAKTLIVGEILID